MKVAVIIATHNYKHWLGHALNSVLEQTLGVSRIVVTDDGSSDGTWDWLISNVTIDNIDTNSIEGRWGQVPITCLRSAAPEGPSSARNKAIQAAGDCDIFAILDADDYWEPTKVERCISRFTNDDDSNDVTIGSVYTDYVTVDIHTGLKTRVFNESFNYERLMQKCVVHSGVFVHRKVFEAVGLYDEELRTCEDYDLHLRTAERFVIAHIPEALSVVRVGNYNSTNTVAKDTWARNHQRVMEKVQQRSQHAASRPR